MRHGVASNLVYSLLVFIRRLVCVLPHRVAAALAVFTGLAWYGLAWRRRRVAKSNLVNAFPEWSHRRVGRTARASFISFMRTVVEFFRRPRYADPAYRARRVSVAGQAHLRAAFERGRGVILLLAHWGNWELIGPELAALGYPHRAVGRQLRSEAFMRFIHKTRGRSEMRFIDKHEAVRPTLAALRAAECVGIFIDQTTSEPGIETTFFGRVCMATRGPAAFALKTGAPVVPAMCPLLDDGRYEVRFDEPIAPPHTGDFQRDAAAMTQRLTSFVEARVREKPGQWLWSHRRWKPLDQGRFRIGFRHVETILVEAPDTPEEVEASRPVYAYLKAAYPHGRLTVLVGAALKHLVEGNPHVDEVIAYGRRSLLDLRRRYFHVAVLLSDSFGSAFRAVLAGIPLRVGARGGWRDWLLTHRVAPRSRERDKYYLEIAGALADATVRSSEATSPRSLGQESELLTKE